MHSLDKSKKKGAVKKVIAAMTVGKDVSMLFPDVVNCMQVRILHLYPERNQRRCLDLLNVLG